MKLEKQKNEVFRYFIAFFTALFMLISFFTLDALALQFVGDIDVVGIDNVPGYVRNYEDDVTFTVRVSSTNEVRPEQLRVNEFTFDTCEYNALQSRYVCVGKFDGIRMDFHSSFDVPVSLFSSISGNPESFIEDKYVTLRKDRSNPVLTSFNAQGAQGGLHFNFDISDENSGVRSFEIRLGSSSGTVLYTETVLRDDDGSFPNTFDKYFDEPLFVSFGSIPDGRHSFFLVAYDGLGNSVSSFPRQVTIKKTPPSLLDSYIAECGSYRDASAIEENKISIIGSNPRPVCVYLILDENPGDDWGVNASLTGFDKKSHPHVANNPLLSQPDSCVSATDSDSYICKFSRFIDSSQNGPFRGRDIELNADSQGMHTFSMEFNVVDDFENVATKSISESVDVVTSMPDIEFFGSELNDGLFYGSEEFINVRLEFQSHVVGIDHTETKIDASGVGGNSDVNADVCTESYCEWNLKPGSFGDGRIRLIRFGDELQNRQSIPVLQSEKKEFDIVINTNVPKMVSIKLTRPSGDIGGFWDVACKLGESGYESDDSCSSCLVGSAADCNLDFWDNRVTYFELDDYFDIEVKFANVISGSAKINVSELIADDVVESSGGVYELSCTTSEGVSTCTRSSIGPLKQSSESILLSITDIGHSSSEFELPFRSYGSFSDGNLWRGATVSDQRPSNVSREWMSLMNLRQTNIIQFDSVSGSSELLHVNPVCTVYDDDGVQVPGLIERYVGDWFGDQYNLGFVFRNANYLGGKVQVNCTLETRASNNGDVYNQDVDVTIDVFFYDSPVGTPSREVHREIQRVVDKYGSEGSVWHWLGNFNTILRTLETACSTVYALDTVVSVLSSVSDILGLFDLTRSSSAGIGATMGTIDSINDMLADNIVKTSCDLIMCRGCTLGENEDGVCGPISNIVENWVLNLDATLVNMASPTLSSAIKDLIDVGEEYESIVDRSLDSENSLILAALTLCPKDLFLGVEKQRQIECSYVRCLREQVPLGATVDECKMLRSNAMCDRVAGELWAINPLGNLVDTLDTIILDMVLNPRFWMGAVGHGACRLACNAGVGCSVCTFTDNLFNVLNKVSGWITFVSEGGIEQWSASWGELNACAGLEGFEKDWEWFSGSDDDKDDD